MFVTIIALIASFQAFDQIFVMTQGGPAFSTETLGHAHLPARASRTSRWATPPPIGYVLVLIILIFSLFQMRYFNRRVSPLLNVSSRPGRSGGPRRRPARRPRRILGTGGPWRVAIAAALISCSR